MNFLVSRISMCFSGGIAATTEGAQCNNGIDAGMNCTVILFIQESNGVTRKNEIECSMLPRQVPGSNLYYASWACMLSSIAIALQWKAAQALSFAEAQTERQQRQQQDRDAIGFERHGDGDHDVDDDDDKQ